MDIKVYVRARCRRCNGSGDIDCNSIAEVMDTTLLAANVLIAVAWEQWNVLTVTDTGI